MHIIRIINIINSIKTRIKNHEGYIASDLTNNSEIITACEKYMKVEKDLEKTEITELVNNFSFFNVI